MPVQHIHAFLVHPGKGSDKKVSFGGTTLALSGGMFDLLDGVYKKSDSECNVHITFRPTFEGEKQNDCRDLIVDYVGGPTLPRAKRIADRLALNTDARSGLGLLFLIAGVEGKARKVVLSRFPTDSAIYVDEKPTALTVEYLERVFMKNKTSYKAVLYEHESLKGGFWNGRAVDKQLNPTSGEPSVYWISDFLLSDFTVTAARGTRRFASALRDATRNAPLEVKQELTAAATLAIGLAGQKISINSFATQFNLSPQAKEALLKELKTPQMAHEVFELDAKEYRSLIAYKSVELNNGALLTAQSGEFDEVFKQEKVAGEPDQVKFSTKGTVVNEKLKSTA